MQDLVNLAASMDTGWSLVGAALVFFAGGLRDGGNRLYPG